MERRDLTLTTRVEDVREPRSSTVIHFELAEIKAHFDQSLTAIREQFVISHFFNSLFIIIPVFTPSTNPAFPCSRQRVQTASTIRSISWRGIPCIR